MNCGYYLMRITRLLCFEGKRIKNWLVLQICLHTVVFFGKVDKYIFSTTLFYRFVERYLIVYFNPLRMLNKIQSIHELEKNIVQLWFGQPGLIIMFITDRYFVICSLIIFYRGKNHSNSTYKSKIVIK